MPTRTVSSAVASLTMATVTLLLCARVTAAQDVEPNDTSGTASVVALALGGSLSISGSLATGGDLDYYAIDMIEDQILVATTAPSNLTFDVPDTHLTVYDTDGSTQLLEDEDAGDDFPEGSELGSTIRFEAPATGTYYLVVSSCCAGVGPYQLLLGLTIEGAATTVDTDPTNNTTGGADDLGIVGSGSVLQVAFLVAPQVAQTPGDVDMYKVSLRQGDTLVATTVPLEDFEEPDTVMGVFDGSTWYVINDDAGADAFVGSTVRFRAPSTNTYYLVISGFPDNADNVLDGTGSTKEGPYAFVAGVTQEPMAEIPTLSQAGLALLAILLAAGGWIAGRRHE